jgi:hypothetical protein
MRFLLSGELLDRTAPIGLVTLMARFEIILRRRHQANEEDCLNVGNRPARPKSILFALLVTAVAIGVLLAAALVGSIIFVLFLILVVMGIAIGVAKAILRPGQKVAR